MKTIFKTIMKKKVKSLMLPALVSALFMLFNACEKENNEPGITGKILVYKSVKIGNQHNPIGHYVNVYTGKVYTKAEAYEKQAEIDLAFFHAYSNSVFVGPSTLMKYAGDYVGNPLTEFIRNPSYGFNKWTVINNTGIDKKSSITAGQFDAAENAAQLMTLYGQGNPAANLVVLDAQAGDVLQVYTKNGKKGLIKVNSVTGNKDVSSVLDVDIKMVE